MPPSSRASSASTAVGLTRQEAALAGSLAAVLFLTGGVGVLFARWRRQAAASAAATSSAATAPTPAEAAAAAQAVHGLVRRAVEL
jgi:hypothetical protein